MYLQQIWEKSLRRSEEPYSAGSMVVAEGYSFVLFLSESLFISICLQFEPGLQPVQEVIETLNFSFFMLFIKTVLKEYFTVLYDTKCLIYIKTLLNKAVKLNE